MSPSFTVKRGVRYPYYVSSALLRGQKAKVGSVRRISASAIETAIAKLARARSGIPDENSNSPVRELIEKIIDRIDIGIDRVTVKLQADPVPIELPWPSGNKRDLARIEHETTARHHHPPDPGQIQAIVCAHAWVKALSNGTHESVESLAQAVDYHPRFVARRMRLAFIAPDLVKEVLRGSSTKRCRLDMLEGAPLFCWREQLQRTGLTGDLFETRDV